MGWKSLDDMELSGKRVLVRVDINVPVENGRVTDATRIERIVPTITDILAKGGKPMLIAHFGRPKGRVNLEMSLAQVLPALKDALGRKVVLLETLEGAENLTAEAEAADVLLLENIRFYPGEEANDQDFARRLSGLGDVYCNDAFSAAHRAHASTEALARLLPACAGRLMQAELSALEAALGTPERPVGAVVGGAKVSTKIELLENLVNRLDVLVIGGGMANTFLAALGADLGASLQEPDFFDTAKDIMAQADKAGCRVILPVDGLVAREFAAGADHEVVQLGPDAKLEADQMVLDAGPDSIAVTSAAFEGLKTLIWNGPMGAFEIAPFDTATVAAAKTAARQTRDGALISVAGGGDTVAALNQAGAAEDFTYISTAGGAFLEWMEGKELPGVAALSAS
ncbi:phosphoglycerate kinase [Sulfitobacter mediterraneus]|uniref:phosphoglycerate kinase n=1 Tax=Sulfitobacter mediterraneus TaxID=83219 RepID=UPI0019397EB6|nr:phosphoglycerate kinase [Sulfitobacter mediterraneus]MBM1556886.1 phosphoglycerate kinase [Sulfitobacter mediterraneus]MBM1569071.1 phosphoglycerate kinase [Sulfitobacter mediterraneus]MBM1572498.1 phosphoglycerate kinase [Sulfitobacter mediterraneus]MBM1576661.1 phosphoglycerate kinase [Sulfitobacter mediterraneus]MBM1579844.1 phosphoglycerate kinase [Sulfitobacter mediterraneus]